LTFPTGETRFLNEGSFKSRWPENFIDIDEETGFTKQEIHMIKAPLLQALNNQLNAEYYSAYLYLSMSAYAEHAGFKGISNWLFIQSREEMAHGTHIYHHILERGAVPVLADIKAPPASYNGIKEVFEKVLAHERHVSELIDRIATLALEEKDHATYQFILWYVDEQVEEEAAAEEILNRINLMAGNSALLYHLDSAFAARTFTDPFAN
jgi:ferritin